MERGHRPESEAQQPLSLPGLPSGHYQAPRSLFTALESRIAQYEQALTSCARPDELLRDERWELRCAALERLGATPHDSTRAILEHALADEHYQVRVAALKALEQYGASAPLPPFLDA